MSKFNIDIDDMIKFFKEVKPVYINREKIDIVKIFKKHFQTPINIDEYIGEEHE